MNGLQLLHAADSNTVAWLRAVVMKASSSSSSSEFI